MRQFLENLRLLQIAIVQSLIEAYNIIEIRLKLNNRTSFCRKIFINFADNISLIRN